MLSDLTDDKIKSEEAKKAWRAAINKLSKEKRQRLGQLAASLAETEDGQEIEEIVCAMIEIMFPDRVLRDPLGATGDLEQTVEPKEKRLIDNYHRNIGQQIMRLREAKGWTQDQLAEKSGLIQSHICRLELGQHSPTRKTIRKLADALGVEPSKIDFNYED